MFSHYCIIYGRGYLMSMEALNNIILECQYDEISISVHIVTFNQFILLKRLFSGSLPENSGFLSGRY